MKKIVVNIHNGLLAEAITRMLQQNGEFQPHRENSSNPQKIVQHCIAVNAEILLMEVSYASGTSVRQRIDVGMCIRSLLPQCKIVLLCDENSAPDIARDIQTAKKDGVIDGFFFASVSGSYLIAALNAM